MLKHFRKLERYVTATVSEPTTTENSWNERRTNKPEMHDAGCVPVAPTNDTLSCAGYNCLPIKWQYEYSYLMVQDYLYQKK